ncbi:hydrolase 1, exosortase A system-associated [Erythrobacter gaetbuli]|uniref:Hydrolase 1, exosortase A system-associated n=1 Tax=Qipengyuania gaetbuli TaxID=266952 RepID=A0A844XXQ8_9SPHN|nr:hydrolase 1, exosortase A system-associated [Qipengyuania gaetbuli]MXO50394.1 hydrolase 1, exosortase A system-associated [Qipengyuania gaetbuli]
MKRLHLAFHCNGLNLAGTLDNAPGTTGLLIVTGGQEPRAGAFGWQARLASEIAAAGFPVFRFDRRGIGDSDGEDRGFDKSRADIAAALRSFRALVPQMTRVVGFGNCDGASALMLTEGLGFDALVLSNPWAIDEEDGPLPSPARTRARYRAKLADPGAIWRLLTGKTDLGKIKAGLKQAAKGESGPSRLAQELQEALGQFDGPVRFLLAQNDRTAQAFADNWPSDERIRQCPGAGHAYAELDARAWLRSQLLEALRA